MTRGRQYCRQIVAVDGLRGDVIGCGKAAYVFDVGLLLAAREFGVAIVLADEQHRQAPQRGDIQRLVKRTGARRTIAEKYHADVLSALRLRSPRRPRGEREIAGHDTGRPQHAVRCVDQVHRTAATAAQAIPPAQNFGESRLNITTLGEHMAMPAMTREQHVLALELGADTDCNGFLSGGKVRESRDLAGGREPLYLAFEQAYPPERTVHLLPVSQRWFGHRSPHNDVRQRAGSDA